VRWGTERKEEWFRRRGKIVSSSSVKARRGIRTLCVAAIYEGAVVRRRARVSSSPVRASEISHVPSSPVTTLASFLLQLLSVTNGLAWWPSPYVFPISTEPFVVCDICISASRLGHAPGYIVLLKTLKDT
jgi:hypothetical protein